MDENGKLNQIYDGVADLALDLIKDAKKQKCCLGREDLELLHTVMLLHERINAKQVQVCTASIPGTPDGPLETDNKEPKLWRRFELLTEDDAERVRLERVLDKHTLTRQELAIILLGLRVRPEFGKKDFGI